MRKINVNLFDVKDFPHISSVIFLIFISNIDFNLGLLYIAILCNSLP